jgi:hypothetical protein
MERNEDAFWFYNNEIVPIYEDDCHCYFLLFHYDEVGIPKELMEEFVKAEGYRSLKDAQDSFFSPWNIEEFDDFWRHLMDLAYSRGLVRGGCYKDDPQFVFYASCDNIKKRKNQLLDLLMNNARFKKCNNFSIEDSNNELARRHIKDVSEGQSITAHSLDEAILAVDSY